MAAAFFALLSFLSAISVSSAATLTITNSCGYTVWPAVFSSPGNAPLSTTGFVLPPGGSTAVSAPAGWSGRVWGRTLCTTDAASGAFTCVTGDCGTSQVSCAGGGVTPPATLAEFTLDGSGGMDFFDVSLVDGYNLPMMVAPTAAAAGNCAPTGCRTDINAACPASLRVSAPAAASDAAAAGVACKSACEAFGTAEYCCSGAYSTPATCPPTAYSQFFKNACPKAYSYAYDDATSTFTCATGVDYVISFCPTTTTEKSTGQNPQAATVPQSNSTMVYLGADQFAGVPPLQSPLLLPIAVAVVLLALQQAF